MENILGALTIPVFLLLSVGFAAAIVSLFHQNEYDAFGAGKPKGDSVGISYWGQYFGKKVHAPTTSGVKLPDLKAYKKIAKERSRY